MTRTRTLQAHRLMRYGGTQSREDAVVEQLFRLLTRGSDHERLRMPCCVSALGGQGRSVVVTESVPPPGP
jgi:hypothetical protein